MCDREVMVMILPNKLSGALQVLATVTCKQGGSIGDYTMLSKKNGGDVLI